jgi:hypothetical protein
MSSSRLVLIFLGIILIVIVILSSSRIAGALKSRFGKLIPGQFAGAVITPTPTPFQVSPTPTKTVASNYSGPTGKSTPNSTIPATGPAEVAWVLIGGSGAAGFLLRKFSKRV